MKEINLTVAKKGGIIVNANNIDYFYVPKSHKIACITNDDEFIIDQSINELKKMLPDFVMVNFAHEFLFLNPSRNLNV